MLLPLLTPVPGAIEKNIKEVTMWYHTLVPKFRLLVTYLSKAKSPKLL